MGCLLFPTDSLNSGTTLLEGVGEGKLVFPRECLIVACVRNVVRDKCLIQLSLSLILVWFKNVFFFDAYLPYLQKYDMHLDW